MIDRAKLLEYVHGRRAMFRDAGVVWDDGPPDWLYNPQYRELGLLLDVIARGSFDATAPTVTLMPGRLYGHPVLDYWIGEDE